MKFRALLLVGCMVVVPAAALFSHQLPPAVRMAPARWLATLAAWLATGGSRAAAQPATEPAQVAVVPPSSGPSADDSANATHTRLASLGAVAIECRPLPGNAGHLASCRVPVDPEGQLQRVFQAQGLDADAALRELAGAVSAWRRPVAGLAPATLR